jgi:ubiquitin C-terminal hydrolase
MMKEYSELQAIMVENHKEVAPHRFLHYVHTTFKLAPGEQNDAHEFLIQLLDKLECPFLKGERKSIIGTSVQVEPFMCLELPIPREGATLQECIQECLKTEMVEYEGKMVEKRWELRIPPILCIVLLRFHSSSKKKDWKVDIPFQFGEYSLVSICNHYGSAQHGHYTATVHLDEWYEFNDEHVRPAQPTLENAYCLFFRKKP